MSHPKARPNNLDFLIPTSGKEIYVKNAVVLVQSIINNNQWANKIKFHIFQDNLSPEQFKVFQSFEKKYPKVEVAFIDLKTDLKEELDHNASSVTHYQIDAVTKISPVSKWIILLEANTFNVASFEPVIQKLDLKNLTYQVLESFPMTSPLDGKLIPYYYAAMFVINYDFFIQNKVYKKFLDCSNLLKSYYPATDRFRHSEIINSTLFSYYPHGEMFVLGMRPQNMNEIKNNQVIVKYMSGDLSPWHEGFPDNSLKQLYLETADQNPYTKNFQVPDPQFPPQQKVIFWTFLLKCNQYIAKPSLALIGKISPKLFRSIYRKLLKLNFLLS